MGYIYLGELKQASFFSGRKRDHREELLPDSVLA